MPHCITTECLGPLTGLCGSHCTISIHLLFLKSHGSVTSTVSSVSLSRTPPLSRPRSNPNPAVVVATSAMAAAANLTVVRRSRDPTTATQGARGYELELHRWWHQKGEGPPTRLPRLPCSSDPNPEQPNSLNEWFVKCPNNAKVRICSVFLFFLIWF